MTSQNSVKATHRWWLRMRSALLFSRSSDPFACEIVSLEALLRGPQGEPPLDYFSRLSREQLYQLDLRSKKIAFAQAKQLGIEA